MSTLEQWAASLINDRISFKERGRDRSGLDCWGLVKLAYLECFNKSVDGYEGEYESIRDFNHLHELFDKHRPESWQEVKPEKPGDVILLRLRGRPIHVGLVLGNQRMIHIEERIQVCVENYTNAVWRNRVLGFYRPITM